MAPTPVLSIILLSGALSGSVPWKRFPRKLWVSTQQTIGRTEGKEAEVDTSLWGLWRLPFQTGLPDGHVKAFHRENERFWIGYIQELGSLLPKYGYVVGEQVFRHGVEISPGIYEGEGMAREGKEGGGILTTWEPATYVVTGDTMRRGTLVYDRVK